MEVSRSHADRLQWKGQDVHIEDEAKVQSVSESNLSSQQQAEQVIEFLSSSFSRLCAEAVAE